MTFCTEESLDDSKDDEYSHGELVTPTYGKESGRSIVTPTYGKESAGPCITPQYGKEDCPGSARGGQSYITPTYGIEGCGGSAISPTYGYQQQSAGQYVTPTEGREDAAMQDHMMGDYMENRKDSLMVSSFKKLPNQLLLRKGNSSMSNQSYQSVLSGANNNGSSKQLNN